MNTSGAATGPRAALVALVASIAVLSAGCAKTTTGTGASPTTTPSTSETPSAVATPPTTRSPSAPPPTPTATSATGVALTAVEWNSVYYGGIHFPTDCQPDVRQVAYVTPAPGVTDAAIVVSCHGGAGTPPSALLVFDKAEAATTPHMLQTLISYYDGLVFSSFSAEGASLSAAVSGYSLSGQPSSYFQTTLVWQWKGGEYQLQTTVPSHAPICGAPTCVPISSIGEATL